LPPCYARKSIPCRSTRYAHNTVIVFLDAVTWLIHQFVFRLLVWPLRLSVIWSALTVAVTLMVVARPAQSCCALRHPFRRREKAFISWVGRAGR
jgi:NhaP-type Na+/H+ and K+/H+ antiporter